LTLLYVASQNGTRKLLSRQLTRRFVCKGTYKCGQAAKAGAYPPRAFKGDNKDFKEFAVSKGGETATKSLHQTVVVTNFV